MEHDSPELVVKSDKLTKTKHKEKKAPSKGNNLLLL